MGRTLDGLRLAGRLTDEEKDADVVSLCRVAVFRGVEIMYSTELKQFIASVKSKGKSGHEQEHEIKRRTQSDVEKQIVKLLDDTERVKGILVDDYHKKIEVVELLGPRKGSRYSSGVWEYLDKDGRKGKTRWNSGLVPYSEGTFKELTALAKEAGEQEKSMEERWSKAKENAGELKIPERKERS